MLGLRQARVLDIPDELVRASTGLAGGGGGKKEICGAVVAGVQAIGLKYGRVDKLADRKPAMELSGRLIAEFKNRFGTVSCHELTKDFPDFHGRERKEHCANFVASVADWLNSFLQDRQKQP